MDEKNKMSRESFEEAYTRRTLSNDSLKYNPDIVDEVITKLQKYLDANNQKQEIDKTRKVYQNVNDYKIEDKHYKEDNLKYNLYIDYYVNHKLVGKKYLRDNDAIEKEIEEVVEEQKIIYRELEELLNDIKKVKYAISDYNGANNLPQKVNECFNKLEGTTGKNYNITLDNLILPEGLGSKSEVEAVKEILKKAEINESYYLIDPECSKIGLPATTGFTYEKLANKADAMAKENGWDDTKRNEYYASLVYINVNLPKLIKKYNSPNKYGEDLCKARDAYDALNKPSYKEIEDVDTGEGDVSHLVDDGNSEGENNNSEEKSDTSEEKDNMLERKDDNSELQDNEKEKINWEYIEDNFETIGEEKASNNSTNKANNNYSNYTVPTYQQQTYAPQSPTPEPTPTTPEPTPTTPEPTPATPVTPEPTPTTPEPTPTTPEPTPVTPEPTPVTPEPTPVTPEPTPSTPDGGNTKVEVIVEKDPSPVIASNPTPSYGGGDSSYTPSTPSTPEVKGPETPTPELTPIEPIEYGGTISSSINDINIPQPSTAVPSEVTPTAPSTSKSGSFIPPIAGLGAAVVAGIGTKSFLDKDKNKKDEIETLEYEEEYEEDFEDVDTYETKDNVELEEYVARPRSKDEIVDGLEDY